MSTFVSATGNVLKQMFGEFSDKKVKRIMAAITLLMLALFLYLYQAKLNPINVARQQLPIVSNPVLLFNLYGTEKDPLRKPMAVAEINRRIYVSDADNHRLQVFDYEGKPLGVIGKEGSGKGQFEYPYGLGVDANNQLYVADITNNNISVLSAGGQFLRYFASTSDIQKPAGLYIADNQVYVADIGLNKVIVFDMNGKKLREIGSPGTEPGKLRSPNAVTVYKNKVYVSDTGNDRVQIFQDNGKFIGLLDGPAKPGGQSNLLAPRGVCVDGRGTVFVVNNLLHTVNGYDQANKKLFTVGAMGKDDDKFYLPNGLWIDGQGRIYITDTVNQRVDVYQN